MGPKYSSKFYQKGFPGNSELNMIKENKQCIIIGAGKMGLLHGALANRHEYLTVVGVVDPSWQSRMVATGIGINASIFNDVEQATRSIDKGLAIICTPPKTHYPVIKNLLEKDWSIFVEKPLTMDSDSSHDLVRISRERGIYTQVGFQLRFNPVISFISEKINEERESERWNIRKIHLSILSPQFIHIKDHSSGEQRGGIEWDLLPHVVDLANHLTGLRNIDDVEIISSCRDSWTSAWAEIQIKGLEVSLNSDWASTDVRKVEIRGRLDLENGEKINFDSDRIWMETNGLQLFHSRIGQNPYFEIADQEYSKQMDHLAKNIQNSTNYPAADFESGLLVDQIIDRMML